MGLFVMLHNADRDRQHHIIAKQIMKHVQEVKYCMLTNTPTGILI